MIPFLPDLPSAPAALNAGGTWPQATTTPEAAGLDFAGLLGAVFAPPPAPPAPLAESGTPVAGEATLAAEPHAPSAVAQTPFMALPVPLPLPLPAGKIVPDAGTSLPPAVLAADPAAAVAAPVPVTPHPALQDAASLPDPADAAITPTPAPAPQPPAQDAVRVAEQPADLAVQVALVPTPGALPPMLAPVLAPVLPPALAAAPPVPVPARLQRTGPLSPADRAHAPLPARVTVPPAEDASEVQADAPFAPQSPPPTPFPAADSAPQPAQAAQPAPTFAAMPAAPAHPAPDRIESARNLAPQQELTIAQVGDLREALRSARPEMTLRHAEFGFVSLRLEQPAPEQWRAVLASRDPGFVPAIQAALSDRAVAAASASADSGSFTGQNGTPQNGSGQNGSGDHRYGASPNGGQAGLSPYLGQSGQRDGEAAPDHRRPSTAAALAARDQDAEAASGSRPCRTIPPIHLQVHVCSHQGDKCILRERQCWTR